MYLYLSSFFLSFTCLSWTVWAFYIDTLEKPTNEFIICGFCYSLLTFGQKFSSNSFSTDVFSKMFLFSLSIEWKNSRVFVWINSCVDVSESDREIFLHFSFSFSSFSYLQDLNIEMSMKINLFIARKQVKNLQQIFT